MLRKNELLHRHFLLFSCSTCYQVGLFRRLGLVVLDPLPVHPSGLSVFPAIAEWRFFRLRERVAPSTHISPSLSFRDSTSPDNLWHLYSLSTELPILRWLLPSPWFVLSQFAFRVKDFFLSGALLLLLRPVDDVESTPSVLPSQEPFGEKI